MIENLRRLAATGFAYTAASVVSKLFAVALLPLYTAHVLKADYGAAELLFAAVIAASIVVRFGLIEALLRIFYLPEEDGDEVISTGFAALFWSSGLAAALALLASGPLTDLLFSSPGGSPLGAAVAVGTAVGAETDYAELVRIAIGGLWLLTLYEYLVTILRLDERARAYFVITIAHVLVAIPLTVWLVVFKEMGAKGILLGSYASGIPFVGAFIWNWRARLSLRPNLGLLRRMVRYGLPTMPAELSLYSLNFIDRIIIVRYVGLVEAGLYALAFKFSQAMQLVVRGFQLAWPPLAYSIEDDTEAARTYAVVVTLFTALCAFIVTGLWLQARLIADLLADDSYFEAYRVIGLLSLGGALYGIYLALLVVLGRTKRTEYNLPATAAGMVVNVALNLVLVPTRGIEGAGIALVASYLVVVVLMNFFTQRLFPVVWRYGRIAVIVAIGVGLVGFGEAVLPSRGLGAFLSRSAVWLAYLPLLYRGAFSAEERAFAARLVNRR